MTQCKHYEGMSPRVNKQTSKWLNIQNLSAARARAPKLGTVTACNSELIWTRIINWETSLFEQFRDTESTLESVPAPEPEGSRTNAANDMRENWHAAQDTGIYHNSTLIFQSIGFNDQRHLSFQPIFLSHNTYRFSKITMRCYTLIILVYVNFEMLVTQCLLA